MTKQIIHYQTSSGRIPFQEWYYAFRDERVTAKIAARIARAIEGHYGDYKNLGMGIFEIRIHWGPGYRIYFGLDGLYFAILLLGGDKSSQESDIHKARIYWEDYLRRKS